MSGSYSSGFIVPNNITTDSESFQLSLSFIIIFLLILFTILILNITCIFKQKKINEQIVNEQITTDI